MRRTRDEGIGLEELAQAARNHGMPLEALRYDVTPAGLHYLLIHYDIPAFDPDGWRLEIGGHVERPLTLSLEDLRARPAVTEPVTLECAGNGRALYDDRPVSQPWLLEAVGTASWTGTPLAPLLEEAGLDDDAVDIVFTGLDRGIEGGEERAYERALPVAEARRDEVILAYAMNGQPLLPQHGAPVRLIVPGWYGMTHVKWLASIRAIDGTFDGYQHTVAYRFHRGDDDPGIPLDRIRPRALMVPPGIPVVPRTGADPRPRDGHARGTRLVRRRPDRARRGQHRRRRVLAGCRAPPGARRARLARLDLPVGGHPGDARARVSGDRRRGRHPARRGRVQHGRLREQRGAAGAGQRHRLTRAGFSRGSPGSRVAAPGRSPSRPRGRRSRAAPWRSPEPAPGRRPRRCRRRPRACRAPSRRPGPPS